MMVQLPKAGSSPKLEEQDEIPVLTSRCLEWQEGGVGGDCPYTLWRKPGRKKGERHGWLRREADIGAGAVGKGSRCSYICPCRPSATSLLLHLPAWSSFTI